MSGTARDLKQRRAVRARALPFLATVWVALAVGVGGCGQRLQTAAEETPATFAQEEGGRLFESYCQSCHGEFGWGDGRFYASSLEPPPPDFTEASFVESTTDEDMIRAITEGTAGIGKSDLCPAWGRTFRAEEITYLVTHIRWMQAQAEAESPPMSDSAEEP